MSPHVTGEITLDAKLTVRVWGEHTTPEQLVELVDAERETLARVLELELRCDEAQFAPGAFLTEILDADVDHQAAGELLVETPQPRR